MGQGGRPRRGGVGGRASLLLVAYAWLDAGAQVRRLDESFPPPAGFERVEVAPGSFGDWLRGLPLKPAGAVVRSHRGAKVAGADRWSVAAVADLDVGGKDLQQCADSIIRLHAEWLWAAGRAGEIGYRFTSGHLATWRRWARGDRPKVRGNRVRWTRSEPPDDSRAAFRRYLDLVFLYAGTISLARYEKPVPLLDLAPGDFFVAPGSPGHAVIVLDLARGPGGERRVLLGQGFTPAQDFHVLADGGDPWFTVEGDSMDTPFWEPFPWSSLRRLSR